MKKIMKLLLGVTTINAILACSLEENAATSELNSDSALQACHNTQQSSSSEALTPSISDSLSSLAESSSSSSDSLLCDETSLKDQYTLYFFGLDEQQAEGTLVKGVCGNALHLSSTESVALDADLTDTIPEGTIEFWFRPDSAFLDGTDRTLLGNDGSRLHFIYSAGGLLYFQKNQSDSHIFTYGAVNFTAGEWYHISGEWGGGFVSLYVNDERISQIENTTPYTPSPRTDRDENVLRIGVKSYCCMEGPGFYDPMTTDGTFDLIRISSIRRHAQCAITKDQNTLYFFDLDEQQAEGTLVKGVCGNALHLSSGESVTLDADPTDTIPEGTIEFWFRPDAAFLDGTDRTLLGNDGSRLHFIYSAEGNLYFQKNQSDSHIFTYGAVNFTAGKWYRIAGEWGDGLVSLYVNGELISQIENSTPYTPSPRIERDENVLRIGVKSYCCMEEAGFYSAMTTDGTFDQLRISSIRRF